MSGKSGNDVPAGSKDVNIKIKVPSEETEEVVDWLEIRGLRVEKERHENKIREYVAYVIVGVFALWAVLDLPYIMFFNGNSQVFIAGSAIISGPLGVVIGYYFGGGEGRRR